ncbi:hypothetical protein EJB05_35112, partial [Eragrostis curvula]
MPLTGESSPASAVQLSEGPSSPAPASLPDNDDILREILLRLPPLPSSLPRASAVSKRWRRLVSDPHFARSFRAHHRTPPLLGFFAYHSGTLAFTSALDPPDRIPPARFTLAPRPGRRLCFLGCRHGLALLLDWALLEAVVWDPITGRQHCIEFPPEFKVDTENYFYNGAVLGPAGDNDGDDRHFRLVLVRAHIQGMLASACLYESKSGKWGSITSTAVPSTNLFESSVLVGNALYWLLSRSNDLLKFDLDRQALTVIQKLAGAANSTDLSCFQVLRTHNGELGLAVLSEHTLRVWRSIVSSDGVVRWVLRKTVDLGKLLSLTTGSNTCPATITGFDEDSNVMFLCTSVDFFMIQLESMKFTKLLKNTVIYSCYPYTSFYPEGLNPLRDLAKADQTK